MTVRIPLLVLILFAQIASSQTPYKAVDYARVDSLEYLIYKLKDSLRRLQYELFFSANFHSVDSTVYGSDSILLNYKTKTGKLIKRHVKRHLTADGFASERIEHYHGREQPEFIEHWELARSSGDDSSRYFVWKIYSCDRYLYDSFGRVVTWIRFYPTFSRRRVRRIDYNVGVDGSQVSKESRIPIEKFWD